MSQTVARIEELFTEIDSLMWGQRERALIDEAVRLAVDSGLEELEYAARMRLTASAQHTGDTDTMLSSFAWCLAKYDSDPSRFPADIDNGAADLLWQFKWMAGTLSATPIFSRDDIEAVLEDMRAHYERAGLGTSGVLTARFEEAWDNGRIADAEALRTQILSIPRDDHSHCDACVRSQFSGFLAETDREAEALVLIDELVEGGFSCGDEPEFALSRALIPFLRSGRLEEAKSAHLRSYRLSRDSADKISIVANHLVFCALTGNEARGLAMLERHIGWLAHDGLNVTAHFSTLAAFGVLLEAIERSGHGDSPVRGSNAPQLEKFFPARETAWTARELAAASWAAAAKIGSAFDERNGNDYYARLLETSKALASEHYELPINTDTFAPVPVTLEEPTDAAGWRMRARELAFLGEAPASIAAARRGIEGAEGVERDDIYSLLLGGLVRLEDWDGALAVLPDRIASLRGNGRIHQAELEERVGLAVFGRLEDADREALERELEYLPTTDAPATVLADVRLSLAAIYMQTDRVEDAGPLLPLAVEGFDTPASQRSHRSALMFLAQHEAMSGDRETSLAAINRLLETETDRAARAQAHSLRARLLGGEGEFTAGAADADEAARLFTALDAREETVGASALAGALLSDAGELDEAISRYRFAVRQSELLDDDATGLRFSFGRALVRGGLGAEAAEVLQQVFEAEAESEEPPASRAETLYWLGHAFSDSEEYGSALGAWNSGIALYEEGEAPGGSAKTGLAVGRLFGRFGQHDDASEALSAALEQARKVPEDLGTLTEVLHSLGSAQAHDGNEAGLAALDEVLALAEENEAAWLAADVTDSRARALSALGRGEEAIPVALSAADRYAATGDTSNAANAELLAARILTQAGRGADAAPIFRSAIERAIEAPGLRATAGIELADALDALGRTAEAREARDAAERV